MVFPRMIDIGSPDDGWVSDVGNCVGWVCKTWCCDCDGNTKFFFHMVLTKHVIACMILPETEEKGGVKNGRYH